MGIRWMKYTLPNGREVYLTQRPDRVDDQTVDDFIAQKNPSVRFCFCDDYVEPPIYGPPWHWLVWVPGRKLPIENVFSFMSMMKRYDERTFISRPIWLHCDSSSMRAPTFFGCWLRANFKPEAVRDIVSKVEFYPERYEPHHPRSRNGTFLFEDPIWYSNQSFKLDPGIKSLVRCWKMGGEKLAYTFYMKFRSEI